MSDFVNSIIKRLELLKNSGECYLIDKKKADILGVMKLPVLDVIDLIKEDEKCCEFFEKKFLERNDEIKKLQEENKMLKKEISWLRKSVKKGC